MSTPGAAGAAGAGAACAVCGAELEPGAAFCGTCGARVPAGAAVADAAPVAGAAPAVRAAPLDPGAPVRSGWAPAGPVARTAHADPPGPPPPGGPARVAPSATAPGWSLGADVDDAVAPVWRRLVALLVDQALAVLVGGAGLVAVLPALRGDGSVGALLVPGLLLLLLAAGQWFAEAFAGRTVGGALLGTRTVSARTGRAPGLWAVLVRSVVQALGVLLGGVGVYVVAGSGAWDEGPEQRGWHDKAAGTLVLRARAPRREDPEPPAARVAAPASPPAPRPTGPTSGPPRPAAASAAPTAPIAPAQARVTPTSGPPAPAEDARAAVPAAPVPAGGAPGATPGPDGPRHAASGTEAPAPAAADPARTAAAASAPTIPAAPAPASQPVAEEPVPVEPGRAEPVVVEPVAAEAVVVEPVAAEPVVVEPVVVEPVPAEPVPATSTAPAADAASGLPDTTIPTANLGDLEHTRVGRWAGSLDAAASTLTLVLDTGERVAVTGPGLVGRRPAPGGEDWAHLVTIDDPEQSVSSTHLAFWPVDGGLDVLDRGSTNGTVLLDAAGKPWSLPPGQPARVGAGWTLVLGSRRITVASA